MLFGGGEAQHNIALCAVASQLSVRRAHRITNIMCTLANNVDAVSLLLKTFTPLCH